jgi:hypothetical protein
MCNGANHASGCECGFGPPYPGLIEKIESVEWIEEAVNSKEAFNRALTDLNLDKKTVRDFNREYFAIDTGSHPSKLERLKRLKDRLEYKIEDTRSVPVKVPLFKLHSPSAKGATVTYRESEIVKKTRGWLLTVFGIGMGATNIYRVVYDQPFVSSNGECWQVYVPLVLEVKSVAVYEAGVFKSRGARAEIAGIEDQSVLRKRGCDRLDDEQCANKLSGSFDVINYSFLKKPEPHKENFTKLWGNNVRQSIELEAIRAFGLTITPLAELEHQQKLDLEFNLPGKRNYALSYNASGLHWDVSSR